MYNNQRGRLPKGRKPIPPPKPKLYQTKDPVQVFCRIRPLHDAEEDVCITPVSNTVVQLSPPNTVAVLRNGVVKETQYTFKYIFKDTTTQNELFSHTAFLLVNDLLNGRNGLLFTYGVTGSGKTFTMTGTPQNGGILPRCLDVIFNSLGELQANKYVFKPDKMNGFDIQSDADAMLDRQKDSTLTLPKTPKTPKKREYSETEERVPDTSKIEDIDMDSNYSVFVQYVEIYNNYIYDLLEEVIIDPLKPRPPQSKILREDGFHNMYIHGCTEVEVKSTDDAFEAFYKGQRRRRVAHTSLNTESSRSHSVFTIRLAQAPLDLRGEAVLQEKGAVCISQLSLVDLAGSERTARTRNCGDRLREAGNINNSLMVLRACIETLRENQIQSTSKMVPYRDSKLTHLFKNYFDGEGKVRMIICINPSMADYEENVHVMRFAELTQEVQIARPTIAKLDLGLTPGRRKANLIYKDAIEKLNEMKGLATPRSVCIPTAPPLTPMDAPPPRILKPIFMPNVPEFELQDPMDDCMLPKFKEFLLEHMEQKARKLEYMDNMEATFRCNLVNFEQNYRVNLHEIINRKCELESSNKRLKVAENQLTNAEQELVRLQRRFDTCEQEKKNLQREVEIKDVQLSRGQMEKVNMKAKLEDKRILEKERLKLEMAKLSKEKEGKLKAKMWVADAKLRTMRDIVNENWVPPRPGKAVDPKPVGMVTRNAASTSDPKINTESMPRRRQRSVSPQPLTSVAVANPKHRRSHSGGPVWIDHTPKGTIETGTILQPILRKKKSLSKLDVKDLKQDASKYVITHQEQNLKGDVKTSLFKGNVIPSAGGGAQVIFNDVEIMKHESPCTRKRSADGQQRQTESSGEWTDTEIRCATGIEGHRRTRSSIDIGQGPDP